MTYDITFCSRDCNNKQCQRNLKYIDKTNLYSSPPFISVADWKDCKDFKGEEKNVWNTIRKIENSRRICTAG